MKDYRTAPVRSHNIEVNNLMLLTVNHCVGMRDLY